MKTKELMKIYSDMENGIYNFCDEKDNCTKCGECCSAILPLSENEIRTIKMYTKTHHIKPHRHNVVMMDCIDLICPFLNKEHKCDIYPVRPKICKAFKCNNPPSKVEEDRKQFWKNRTGVYMHDLFK